MSLRAILSARLSLLLGIAVSFPCSGATSQEASDGIVTVGPSADQSSPAAPIGDGAFSSSAPAAANRSFDGINIQRSIGHGSPLWAVPLTSLTATRERPIFSPSRRPPAVVDAAPLQAPPPSVNYQSPQPLLSLVGAIAGGAEGIAIFLDETTKGIVRLKTGESHSGWILRSVQGREATLQRGGEIAVVAIPNPPAN
jgi:hypothetical protein